MHEEKNIYVFGSIDCQLSKSVIEDLHKFSSDNRNIYMYINSDGGDMDCGFAIIDHMRLVIPNVFTIVTGQALSMACIIAMFGDEKCRFATCSSIFMMHDVNIDIGSNDIDKHMTITKFMKENSDDKTSQIMNRICEKEQDIPVLKEKIRNNLWMNPQKAIEYNIIDGIWDEDICEDLFKGIVNE